MNVTEKERLNNWVSAVVTLLAAPLLIPVILVSVNYARRVYNLKPYTFKEKLANIVNLYGLVLRDLFLIKPKINKDL